MNGSQMRVFNSLLSMYGPKATASQTDTELGDGGSIQTTNMEIIGSIL